MIVSVKKDPGWGAFFASVCSGFRWRISAFPLEKSGGSANIQVSELSGASGPGRQGMAKMSEEAKAARRAKMAAKKAAEAAREAEYAEYRAGLARRDLAWKFCSATGWRAGDPVVTGFVTGVEAG